MIIGTIKVFIVIGFLIVNPKDLPISLQSEQF